MASIARSSVVYAGLVFTLLAIAGCSGPDKPPAADAGTRLAALVEQYFDEMLPLEPVYATFIGEHRYDDRLANDMSPEYLARRQQFEERYLTEAKAIPVDDLAEADRLTLDVFVGEREVALEGMKFPGHLLPIDQLYSLPSEFAQLGSGTSAQPFAMVGDYDNFLGRMRDFSIWVDQAIVNMREGMKTGIVQPKIVMEAVVQQLADIAVDDPKKSLFWQPVADMPAGFSSVERERLTAAYAKAIDETVLPAYRRLGDFVRNEYLPVARGSVSWSALPEGEAWYRFMAETNTTTQMSPAEIHELGLSEVARILAEMEAVRVQVGFKGDLHAFFDHLKTDPQFYFTKPEDLIEGYRALQVRIDALLPKLFSTLPAADYEVRPVEAFRAEAAAGASYQGPAPDGSRPGIFYINTFNLRAQPKFGMETLSLHEAAPGHHFQVSTQLGLTSLPRFRRFSDGYVAYVEGWALYAESLGKELGVFTDPYQYYGRLSDEMLRAMRLVVDTGLHSRGWTREQSIRYMLDNSSMAESDIRSEVDRYIANPGQALGYKIGDIRIRALRTKAEAALGARFDVRAFHDAILRDGALPIGVLEAKMDRWLAAQIARTE